MSEITKRQKQNVTQKTTQRMQEKNENYLPGKKLRLIFLISASWKTEKCSLEAGIARPKKFRLETGKHEGLEKKKRRKKQWRRFREKERVCENTGWNSQARRLCLYSFDSKTSLWK